MRISIIVIFLTALLSSNAQSNNTPPPYWDKLQKCETLNGEYGHVQAFEYRVKKYKKWGQSKLKPCQQKSDP
nr:hypothetical protein BCU55_03670 [Shewanella sp. 10N.286.48.A6]